MRHPPVPAPSPLRRGGTRRCRGGHFVRVAKMIGVTPSRRPPPACGRTPPREGIGECGVPSRPRTQTPTACNARYRTNGTAWKPSPTLCGVYKLHLRRFPVGAGFSRPFSTYFRRFYCAASIAANASLSFFICLSAVFSNFAYIEEKSLLKLRSRFMTCSL
mgnify:CR=1 FL=1